MANIDGGALSFKSVMENDQMNSAIEETLRRVQGLSDATVAGGKQMDKAFLQTADGIRQALGKVGQVCEIHEAELAKLEEQYKQLGREASAAFMDGRTAEARAIKDIRAGVQGEIQVRKQALEEARNLSNELEKEAAKREESTRQVEENAKAHQSLRGRIRELKEEMALLIDQGIDEQSDAYKALVNELGRLQDIQGDIAQQGKILANDEAKFQGFIQGLSGLSGAFSAATGAISLFAGENENLQKVMTKVQSVMAIAMGMQSVAQTLNKDSAFQLVTLNGLKEWWAGIVAKATVAETAEAGATQLNTAAKEQNAVATGKAAAAEALDTASKGANTVAAASGTAANLTLAGAFRAVGLAIKSIPVFGWVLAGISTLIALVAHFSSKAREAKKAQEEFSKAMIEGCYKPIGKVEELSAKYTALGNNIKEKEQFIKDNKKAFDELGVSVTSVRDAENLLINNKKAFIAAQIAKAKALVYSQQATEKIKKQMELQSEYESMPDYVTKTYYHDGGNYTQMQVENVAKKEKKKEIDALNTEIRDGYKKAAEEETAALKKMKQSGINAVKTYAKGTVGAIEQAISEKQEALKDLVPNSAEWRKANKEIEALQKQIEKPAKKTTSNSDKDPFVEQLEKRKNEYERFKKWINSGDDVLVKSAASEFRGLLAQGATYIDYLKKQRDIILSVGVKNRSDEQIKQLRTLNDQIAEETKKTVLESFNEEIATQLGNAKTTIDILNIIAQKRKELAEDGTDVDNDKKLVLDDAEKNALKRQQDETQKLMDDYASYLDKKIKLDLQYSNDLALLEKARAKATTEEERNRIESTINNLKHKYDKDASTLGASDYEQMVQAYQTFEQKKMSVVNEYRHKREKAAEALAVFEMELSKAQTEDEREKIRKRIADNKEMVREMNREEAAQKLNLDFGQLKASPEYIRAFEDLDFASSETLQKLIEKFEEVKTSVGENLNPEDIKQFTDTIQSMVDELNSRDPFDALKRGYREMKAATNELRLAQEELNRVRLNGGAGTDEEVKAIERVNRAKDNFNRKNKEVRKSEKEVERQVDDLCKALSDVGNAIGGQAGQIISLIGDIGSFIITTIDSVKAVSATGAQAISTIEKASVILAIVSAAYQVATKIINMFTADDGTAAYEKAQKVYRAYIDTLHDVIDAEMELMNTMAGKDAQDKYEHAVMMINKTADAARELGKQYLNAGASKGFLGVKSKSSHGVSQRKDMSSEAWKEAKAVADAYNIDWSKISGGRMVGLFDLTVEQLRALKNDAPLFFAELHEDTRTYINDIIEADEALKSTMDKFNESLVGVSFDTMRDNFSSSLQDMELDAKKISSNIQDYMRKALINDMFKKAYQGDLQKYYDAFAEAMRDKSAGGSLITDDEKRALDVMRESIVSGAVAATEKINKQFEGLMDAQDTSLTGAVKGVTEDTASIVAGQLNAMRINQMEASSILRQQLSALSMIAHNTEYNRFLQSIDKRLSAMQNAGNSLRSHGLS